MVSAGIEARGFIFDPPIALANGTKFVPMRKPCKLPSILLQTLLSLKPRDSENKQSGFSTQTHLCEIVPHL
jgi:adenine/guanine phosphoribosyltransferase-like PRPP-binding protein